MRSAALKDVPTKGVPLDKSMQQSLFPEDFVATGDRPDTLFKSAYGAPSDSNELGQLNSKALEKYSAMHSGFLSHAETAFERTFKKVWLTRYKHYSTPEKFYQRIAQLFSLDEAMVPVLERRFQLPGIRYGAKTRTTQDSFTSTIYLNDDHDYTDPVDNIMRQVFNTRRSREIWTDYCRLFGRLSMEQIDESDLQYVLTTYAYDSTEMAKIFFVRPIDLDKKIGPRKLPSSYRNQHAPVRVLITKHKRLRTIVMSYAHMLYTSQAIPIPRIAQTLGMDPTALYTLGEQVIGDWTLPSPETLTDAIQQTTLMHLS
jgi:hypothetical protein